MELKKAFSFGLPLCVLLVSSIQQAGAQNSVTTSRTTIIESSSSSPKGGGGSTVVSESGVMGVQSSNKKVYHYPKSVQDYKQQVAMLARKGLLSPSKAEEFNTRLADLERLVKNAEAKEWPESVVADLDKKFTAFNADLSTASQPKQEKPAERLSSDKKQAKPPTPSVPAAVNPKTKRPTGETKTRANIAVPTNAPAAIEAGNEPGSKVLPDKPGRRPNVGGGDSKPTGAAGRGN